MEEDINSSEQLNNINKQEGGAKEIRRRGLEHNLLFLAWQQRGARELQAASQGHN